MALSPGSGFTSGGDSRAAVGHSQRYQGAGFYRGVRPQNPALKAVGHSQRYKGAGNYQKLAQRIASSGGTGITSGRG